MAGPKQTWARDAESGAGDAQGHQMTPGASSVPYADTDRNSAAERRPEASTPIPSARNFVSDDPWQTWNNAAGGDNPPTAPDIPVTKGE